MIDLYTLFTTIDESTRIEHLDNEDWQIPQPARDNITDVLEQEIRLLHRSEKSSIIVRGEDDDDDQEDEEMEDEDVLSSETRGAIHEKRVCDIAARMTLAILGGALPKQFAETLQKYKGKVGQSYDKIILELGPIPEKAKPKAKPVENAIVVEEEDPIEDVVEDAIEVGSEMEA